MTTARDLVKSALRKISVVGTGSPLSDEDAQDGLTTLNAMLSSFSVEGGMIYTETQETFSLTSGQASYTIGTGGDFNTDRPFEIITAYTSSGDIDYPMSVYDEKQYAAIAQKDLAGYPNRYYFDGGYPLGKIYLHPTPSGVTTITIFSRKELTGFSDLDTVYSLPPEYEAMIIYNLAVWIAPEYEREAPLSVSRIADRTYNAIEVQNGRNELNASSLDVPSNEGRQTSGNIYGGY